MALLIRVDMDQEVDWFNNIGTVHLQLELHRRVRALKKVATLVTVSAHADFSVPGILHILIPLRLSWPMALPSSEAKKGQDSENVLDEEVRTLHSSSLAARLPWPGGSIIRCSSVDEGVLA